MHDALKDEFFSVVGRGGTVAFGDDYFVIFSDPAVARQTRAFLSDPQRRSTFRGTALENSTIRSAFVRRGVSNAHE